MTRTFWFGWMATLLIPGLAAPLVAGESPLARVPADAPIVIHLRGLEQAPNRLMTLMRNALPAEVVKGIQTTLTKYLHKEFAGRRLRGLPPDGSVFLVLTEVPTLMQERPKAAIILRVDRYAEFRDGLLTEAERKGLKRGPVGYEKTASRDTPVYFVHRGSYAAVTLDEDVAVQLTKKQPGLDSKLGRQAARQFLEADLAAYVDLPRIFKEGGREIKDKRDVFEKLLFQACQFQPGDKVGGEMVRTMTGLLLQAAEDSRSVLGLVYFHPDGLALHGHTRIGPDTKTGALLKTFSPSPLAGLADMPAGQMTYSALKVEPALLKALPSWLYSVSTGSDDGRRRILSQAVGQLTQAGLRARYRSSSHRVGNLKLPLDQTEVWLYDDPARAAAVRLQLVKSLKAGDTWEGAWLKEKPKVKARARTYRGLTLHSVRIVWDVDKMVEGQVGTEVPPANRKKMLEAVKELLGTGRKAWFGSTGKALVQVAAPNWDGARRRLDRYLDGRDTIGRQRAFRDSRKHLPAQASVLTLVDVRSYARAMRRFLTIVAEGAPNGKEHESPVPEAEKGEASYAGLAVTLEPGRGSLDVWFPAAAMGDYYRTFVAPFLQMVGGKK
jgi:hypothetical protein